MHSTPAHYTLREIVCGAEWTGSSVVSRNDLQNTDIDIYLIPNIQKWLQPLDTEHVINQFSSIQFSLWRLDVNKQPATKLYIYKSIRVKI
jgi:hypothetical protein